MRPANTQLLIALLTGLAAASVATSASAAVWEWACQGELGGKGVLFDREGLYIANGKAPAAKPGQFSRQSVAEAIAAVKKDADVTAFRPDDENGGLAGSITFSQADGDKQTQKVAFTERSSTQISQRHKVVCGRDEDTDIYRKVYRFERDGEPARDITMQCVEYQLSTRGGRKGCN
jgi:hypothetical protein